MSLEPRILRDAANTGIITAMSTFGWERYSGFGGSILGLHAVGMSAPIKVVAQHDVFESEHIVAVAGNKCRATPQSSEPGDIVPISGDAE